MIVCFVVCVNAALVRESISISFLCVYVFVHCDVQNILCTPGTYRMDTILIGIQSIKGYYLLHGSLNMLVWGW